METKKEIQTLQGEEMTADDSRKEEAIFESKEASNNISNLINPNNEYQRTQDEILRRLHEN